MQLVPLSPTPEIDLVAVNRPVDQNPAAVYLASLAEGSRRTMRGALDAIAGILTNGRENAFTLEWGALRIQHTRAVREALATRYKAATASKMLCALRGVLEAAWQMEQMSTDAYTRAVAVAGVKGKSLPKGRAVPVSELLRLLESCPAGELGVRDRALIILGYAAGMRRSALVNLDLEHYDRKTGTLTVLGDKGNDDRLVQTPAFVKPFIEEWIALRGEAPGPLLHPVLKGGHIVHRRLNDQTVYTALQRCYERAGVEPIRPHDLRRSFITALFEAGADAIMIQRLAGHKSIETTKRYDMRGEAAKQQAVDRLTLEVAA